MPDWMTLLNPMAAAQSPFRPPQLPFPSIDPTPVPPPRPVPPVERSMQASPPGADLAANQSGWEAVLHNLSTNRNLSDALIMAGATMLQPRTGGQSSAGKIGEGLATGLQTYRAGEDRDIARRAATAQARGLETEADVGEATADERIAGAGVELESLRASLEAAKLEPEKIRNSMEYIDALIAGMPSGDERAARLRSLKAEAAALEFETSPVMRAAKLDTIAAQIESLAASGAFDRKRAAYWPQEIERSGAGGVFTQSLEATRQIIQNAYPDMPPEQVGLMALNHISQSSPSQLMNAYSNVTQQANEFAFWNRPKDVNAPDYPAKLQAFNDQMLAFQKQQSEIMDIIKAGQLGTGTFQKYRGGDGGAGAGAGTAAPKTIPTPPTLLAKPTQYSPEAGTPSAMLGGTPQPLGKTNLPKGADARSMPRANAIYQADLARLEAAARVSGQVIDDTIKQKTWQLAMEKAKREGAK